MWVSLPVTETEMRWIEKLSGPWRLSKDDLYRQSNVELALVVAETWGKWGLPKPQGPILSLHGADLSSVDGIVKEGATVITPVEETAWGAMAGFLRFPSGLIVEVVTGKRES